MLHSAVRTLQECDLVYTTMFNPKLCSLSDQRTVTQRSIVK